MAPSAGDIDAALAESSPERVFWQTLARLMGEGIQVVSVVMESPSQDRRLNQRVEDVGLRHLVVLRSRLFAPFLQEADAVIANLETPITDLEESPSTNKSYLHWADPILTPYHLLTHNISVVSLANNHILDYGVEGLDGTLETLKANALLSVGLSTDDAPQEPVVTMEGKRVVMLGSNNYLGLANHPEVKRAARHALETYGAGCAGSRLLNGTLDIHLELEDRLAAFMKREAALVFTTGFQVNLGVLSCLLGRSDIAFLDSLDHACIIDGCRLGFGKTFKFRHNDMDDLEKKLANAPANKGKLIVVDGVFSMEGDVANLPRIVELKKKYGARLMVDDAHGIGVFGENGRGTPEHFGLEHEVDLVGGEGACAGRPDARGGARNERRLSLQSVHGSRIEAWRGWDNRGAATG